MDYTNIGLIGYAGSGKDQSAEYFQDYLPEYKRYAFADPLKNIVCELFDWDYRHTDGELKEKSLFVSTNREKMETAIDKAMGYGIDQYVSRQRFESLIHKFLTSNLNLKNAFGTFYFGKTSPRLAFQIFGTEICRDDIDRNIWVNLSPVGSYIHTDVRFPNEAEKIKSNGGLLIRIDRENVGQRMKHDSESFISEMKPDLIIKNDGSLDDLKLKVKGVVDGHFLNKRLTSKKMNRIRLSSFKPSAKVIEDTINTFGDRLVTMEIELHRFILPEFNTHRSLSRNFQSSRAIPVDRQIEMISNNPAIPVHLGKNQSGMVADGELLETEKNKVLDILDQLHKFSLSKVAELKKIGLHKQVANRYLEPFMSTKGVVTASESAFEAFFNLRIHKDAQPDIQALAVSMRDAMAESDPSMLRDGQWHLPYVDCEYSDEGQNYFNGDDELTLEEAIKLSASSCAQVSYRRRDQSIDKAIKIYDMLNLDIDNPEPAHFSPVEHIAVSITESTHDKFLGEMKGILSHWDASGNFNNGWGQWRKYLEVGFQI